MSFPAEKEGVIKRHHAAAVPVYVPPAEGKRREGSTVLIPDGLQLFVHKITFHRSISLSIPNAALAGLVEGR